MNNVERFTTIKLKSGDTLRVKVGSVKFKRRGIVKATGILGTELVFSVFELARMETPPA